MTETDDLKIVEQLFDRDEQVLGRIAEQYNGLYKKVLRQLLSDNEDVIECENDVLLAVWNSIPPNRPQNFRAYICKLARNIGINRFKYNTRAKRGDGYAVILDELSEAVPDRMAGDSYIRRENKQQFDAVITKFLKELDPETRVFFVRRYYYLETVSSLAKRYEVSENKVAVRLFRARKKLRKLLSEEGVAL